MDTLSNAAEVPHGYLLREESFDKLQQMRDQLFLLATLSVASTRAEEDEPLELRRSMLARCFESVGLQLDEVVKEAKWLRSKSLQDLRHH